MVTAILSISHMAFYIRSKMAALAPGVQVVFRYIVFIRIRPMRYCENYLAASHRVRLVVNRATRPDVLITFTGAFAFVLRSFKPDSLTNFRPIWWILFVVNGHFTHQSFPGPIIGRQGEHHRCRQFQRDFYCFPFLILPNFSSLLIVQQRQTGSGLSFHM